MRCVRAMLALGFVACAESRTLPPAQPAPPTITAAVLPGYTLRSNPAIRVEIHAPRVSAYRAATLGSRTETVELAIGNAGTEPIDLAGAKLSFDVRLGAVRIPCAARNDVPKRESPALQPGQRAVITRDLCSLPLPGDYAVDARLALPGHEPEHVGSFPLTVGAHGPNVPRAVQDQPGLFAALGGDPNGMRFTRQERESGAYHVMVRLTNASTVPVHVRRAQVVFHVTRAGHAIGCESSHDLAPPPELEPGDSWLSQVPVTCLIDVKGRYDIHAAFATEDEETPLADLSVEVTSDPLLYLPIIPW